MEGLKAFSCLNAVALMTLLLYWSVSVNGQIGTPCSTVIMSSLTPCLNFFTGSSGNGNSPTKDCCDSIKSLMSRSMDCVCLIVTGNVPFSLPINRTFAISLPRICSGSSVPIQCKASGVPLPAPGPVLFGPTPSPIASSPFSPTASKAAALAPAPAPALPPSPSETTDQITPVSPPPAASLAPTANAGIRPVLTPTSTSTPSYVFSTYHLLLLHVGIMILKSCL